MVFSDILYGRIETPEWLDSFIRLPEFLRLRGVRLSNVDSIEFKDFNGPTRWEHCIGVAHLALTYCRYKKLTFSDTVHITLAALLHDIATPPFAHTVEYVLQGFNHEDESNRLLMAKQSNDSSPSTAIFASQLPQFNDVCSKISRQIKIKIDPDEVARYVTGDGEFGFLINGSIDLDNIDNVIRACTFMGIEVNRKTPLELIKWLTQYSTAPTDLEKSKNDWVINWLGYKNLMYSRFYNSSDQELGRQAFLQHLIRRVNKQGLSRTSIIWNTDEQLLNVIENFSHDDHQNFFKNSLADLVQRYKLLDKTEKLTEIELDLNTLRVLRNPIVSSWLEEKLSSDTLEVFVFVKSRRYKEENNLFPSAAGAVMVFKLGTQPIKFSQLPIWQQEVLSKETKGKMLNRQYSNTIKGQLYKWVNDKPWLNLNE